MFRISFGGLGMLVALFVVILIVANRSGNGGERQRGADGEFPDRGGADTEARLMQEIHASLTRMDRRIEALETILMDKLPRE